MSLTAAIRTVSRVGIWLGSLSRPPYRRIRASASKGGSAVSPGLALAAGYLDPRSDDRPVDARRVFAGHQHLLPSYAARAERRVGALPRRRLARLPRVHGDRAQHEGF